MILDIEHLSQASDQTDTKEQRHYLKSIISFSCLLALNIVSFIHYLNSKPTLDSATVDPNFHMTYAIYLFCEGIVVPVIVIVGVRNIKKFVVEKCKHLYQNIVVDLAQRRKKRIMPNEDL